MINRVAIINTCDWGSTGRIAKGLLLYYKEAGVDAIFCYGRGVKKNTDDYYRFCTLIDVLIHYCGKFLTGRLNGNSILATRRLINKFKRKGITQLFIINLHGYVINERLFWDYVAQSGIRVVYIMADESAFLGNCTYRNGCENYKDGCVLCEQNRGMSKIISPNASSKAFAIKKQAYERVDKIVFVGPEFVIKSASSSPLVPRERMEIVDEAIDVRINTPRDATALRRALKINDNQIVIGCVAPTSYPRKGVRYFIEAAKRMEHDDRFVFVQVGYDLKNITDLPRNYIPKGFINNQTELSYYYSLFDLFVFPSLQDTMPNACLDALACGTPLLCFNISGMPYLADESVMTLVDARDVDQMVESISQTKKKDSRVIDSCREYALNRYDNRKYFERLATIMNSTSIC